MPRTEFGLVDLLVLPKFDKFGWPSALDRRLRLPNSCSLGIVLLLGKLAGTALAFSSLCILHLLSLTNLAVFACIS